MPRDNQRNRNDRYSANDVIDMNSFNNAAREFMRSIDRVQDAFGAFVNNVNRGQHRIQEETRRTGDLAKDEMDKLNNYLDNINKRAIRVGQTTALGTLSSNLTGGWSTSRQGNQNEINKLMRSVENGTQTFDQVRDRITDLTKTNIKLDNRIAVTEMILKSASEYIGRYIKSFVDGSEKYYNAYQNTFNSVSARMGMNYSDTRGVYHDMIGSITSDLKSVVNISEELVPMLDRATQAGFSGNVAISKALSDSIDNKIMPWLDTSSDWYNNLFANLSEMQINQIKSSQLQLQATQSGNRLLQSGVINQLESEVAPLLSNIDLNTGGAQNLSDQYQAILKQLVDNGMSTQDAYAQVQTMIKNDKNLYDALSSGSIADVMYAANRVQGQNTIEAYGNMTDAINRLADSAGSEVGVGAVVSTMGYQTAGGWAMNYNQNSIDQQQAQEDAKAMHSATTYYDVAVQTAKEHLTTTQKVQNWLENTGTKLFGEIITALPYGDTFYQQVINGLGTIITILTSMALNAIFSSGSGGLINTVRGLGSRITSGLGNIISRAGSIVSNAANAGTIASGALIAGGTFEIVDAARTAYNQGHTQGTAANVATGAEAAAGIGAIAAALLGSTGVGAALLAVGAAAWYTADKLDETSAVVGEVKSQYQDQVQQMKDNLQAERDAANGLLERFQVDRDYIVDRIELFRQQREAERQAQAQYKADRGDLLSQLSNIESQGDTDRVVEILKAARASNKGIENYLNGSQSFEDVLTAKWYQKLFGGKRDLIQNLSTDQWATLREIAGMAQVEGSYATGLPYVYEDSTVRVHKGERILTAAENADYSGSAISDTMNSTHEDMVRVLREVASEIIIAIREVSDTYRVNSASNTIPRPSVKYDDYAIGLVPQVGRV